VLFLMRLAAQDHRLATWEDLLDELTPRQVTTLLAFAHIEGWGMRADDFRAAVSTSLTMASMSGKVPEMARMMAAFRPIDTPKPREMSPDELVKGIKNMRVTGGDSR
jgi:hypothetical protein